MSSTDLPPSDSARLSFWGWAGIACSLLVAHTLMRATPMIGTVYAVLCTVGFCVGVPGGMHYQADIDAYLSRARGTRGDTLPWPPDYSALTRGQVFRYALRGVPGALTYGLLFPILLALAGIAEVGIIRVSAISALWAQEP